jgi:hypothetical protein
VGGQASPGIHKPNIRTRVSDVGSDARRASLATYRQSLPSQLSGMSAGHASPATCRQDVTASLYATSLQGPPPTAGQGLRARNKSQQQEPPSRSPEPRSLIVIFPIAASSGRLPAKLSMSHDSRPQYCPVEASDPSPGMRESDDGAKRRRLDSEEHSYSTNPHTVKARARVAKLDPRTKKYEDAKANDKKMTKYHVENVVKRSEAYQRASPAEQAALEEEGRNEYMNARYGPCSEEANEDLLTQGRRKLGKDADSYEKSQGGYNKLTKEWGFPEEHSTSEANGAQSLGNVDAQVETQHRDVARNQNNGSAAIPALLRATLRQGGEIESLQQENDGLRRQTSALEEGHMRNARLILAAEGKHVELANRIETLEEWSWSLQSLPPAEALPEDISGRFALLEKRSETQRRNFTAAHQLQVSTSQEISVLRTTSNRHNEALETFKHSTKREKEWRKYLDKLTKEHKVKIEQLEAKLRQEREDKQNFKMATEGRVDAMIKHHQKSSDTMMKKMTALESTVERQSAQIEMLMRSDVPTQKQMAHNAWMESKLLPVKAKACSPKRGRSPPRGPAGWRG